MKGKILLAWILCIFLTGNAWSQKVDRDLLIRTAGRLTDRYFPGGVKDIEGIRTIESGDRAVIYIVDLKPEGWILMSADQKAAPVIGFSFTGRYVSPVEDPYEPSNRWLQTYRKQIESAIQEQQAPVHPGWKELQEIHAALKSENSGITVLPMLKVEWNQSSGWNRYCPEDEKGPGGHAYSGCVSVCMSQAMSRYQFPPWGSGSHEYLHADYGTLTADFAHTSYVWDSMKLSVSDQYNALLLYHAAVSVDMDFGSNSSGAFSRKIPGALKNYFLYSNDILLVSRHGSDEEWQDVLNNELKHGRPIIYTGDADDREAGHAFNIDGVTSGRYYHLNWGWSGTNNGYFTLNKLTPGSFDFNSNQEAIINIRPRYFPTDVLLSDTLVPIELPEGATIGVMDIIDEATDNIYDVSIECDSFLTTAEDTLSPRWIKEYYFDGDTLKTARMFGQEENGSLDTVVLHVTDYFGHKLSKTLVLNISEQYFEGPDGLTPATMLSGKMGIYPNPVHTVIHFIDQDRNPADYGSVRIYSVMGSLVWQKDHCDLSSGLDLSQLAPGIYMLERYDATGLSGRVKFIKQ